MEVSNKSDDGNKAKEFLVFGLLVTVILFIFFIIPLSIALIIKKVTKFNFSKIESLMLLLTSTILISLKIQNWLPEHINWIKNVMSVTDGSKFDIPWLYWSLLIVFFYSLFSLFSQTIVSNWTMGKVRSIRPIKNDQVINDSILPTVDEKIATAAAVANLPTQVSASTTHKPGAGGLGKRKFTIGLDTKLVPVEIAENEIDTHMLLFGATGAGKTEAIKAIAGGLLDLGWDGLLLDLKEDSQTGGLLDWCSEYAAHHAIPFQNFRISDQEPKYWFSALLGMGPDEARDTILASQTFEAAYYRALNEKQLGQLIQALYAAHSIDPVNYPSPTVYDIGKILGSASLEKATRDLVALVVQNYTEFTKNDFDALLGNDKAMIEAAGGLGARLTAMYETRAGRLTLRPGDDKIEFDVTKGGLSYIGLDSLGKPELARLVSTSVLQRMAVYAADLTNGKVPKSAQRFLIVDEANFVARKVLLNLLSRARSAGIAVIVCTQGPTDWSAREAGEPDLTSLVQNCNMSLILRQGERTNAELCADIIGRKEKTIISQQIREGMLTEAGSMSSVVDYIVSPDALRSFTVGEAILRAGSPLERISYVKVARRDPKTIYKD